MPKKPTSAGVDPSDKYAAQVAQPDPSDAYAGGAAAPDPSDAYARNAPEVGIGPLSMPRRIMQAATGAGKLSSEMSTIKDIKNMPSDAARYGELSAANKMQRAGTQRSREEEAFAKTVSMAADIAAKGGSDVAKEVQNVLGANKVRTMSPPSRKPDKAQRFELSQPVGGKANVVFTPLWEDAKRIPKWKIDNYNNPPPKVYSEDRTPMDVVLQEPNDGKSFTEKAMIVLDTPFRGVAGFSKGVQEAMRWQVRNQEQMFKDPESAFRGGGKMFNHIADRTFRSLTNEQPVHFGDLNVTAIRALKGDKGGGDVLTRGEWAFAHGLGLFEDLLVGGKAFPHTYNGPKTPVVAKQMERALKGAGVAAEDLSRFETISQRLAEFALEKPTHPEQFNTVLRSVRKLASKYGVDPQLAEKLIIDKVGRSGGGLGAKGLKRIMNRGPTEDIPALRLKPGTEQKEIVIDSPVPRGAQYEGAFQAPGSREFAQEMEYGAGAAQGTKEALRLARGEELKGSYRALRGSKELSKRFSEPRTLDPRTWFKREYHGDEFARHRDAKSWIDKEKRLLRELGEGTEDAAGRADAIRTGTDKALAELGMTREQAAAPYKFPNQRAKEAAYGFIREMRNLDQEARAIGLDMGQIESYFPYIETKESLAGRLKKYGGKDARSGDPAFTRSRLPHEVGQSLFTEGGEKFITDPAKAYALRVQAQTIAKMKWRAEQEILGGYAKEINPAWTVGDRGALARGVEPELKARGLAVYDGTIGPFKGKRYIIDEGSAKMLDRLTKPEGIDFALKAVSRFHKWWKPRTLLKSLGYTARNLVSDEFMLWMHDVNNARSAADAANVLSYRLANNSPMGFGSVAKDSLRGYMEAVAGRDLITGKPTKIGKWTPEQVAELADEYNILGTGQVAEEFYGKKFMPGMSMNPLSSKFVPLSLNGKLNIGLENFRRLRVFTDKLRKGFTPAEAASIVDKALFNYNEMSRTAEVVLRNLMPFGSWPAMMIKEQARLLGTNPRKMGMFLRAYEGAQHLDPLTRQEAQHEMAMGPSRGYMGMFRVPFARGPEGERQYQLMGGYLPPFVMNIAMPDHIKQEIGMALTPIADAVMNMKEAEKSRTFPGYWGQVRRQNTSQMATAPESIQAMMRYAAEHSPEDFNLLEKVIEPEYDPLQVSRLRSQAKAAGLEGDAAERWVKRNANILRYKWDRDYYDMWQTLDPATHQWMVGLWKSDDEKMKDEALNFLTGAKLRSYGPKQANTDYLREQAQTQSELGEVGRRGKSLGKSVNEKYPLSPFWH